MAVMVKIVVLASFNMDLVMRTARQPAPGETLQGEFAMHLGGKGFNQAIAARRLGADVSVIGRVGDDGFGRRFLEALDREGIDRTNVSIDPQAGTGVASIVVDANGENAIVQAPQANRRLTAADVEASRSAFSGASAALLQLETSDAAVTAFAASAKAAGAHVVFNPAPARAVADNLVDMADVLIVNEVEAEALSNERVTDSAQTMRVASRLAETHRCAAIITLGRLGAVAASSDTRIETPAHVVAAIDTTGAGDAFCAALTVSLAEGARLHDAMHFANAAGALATTKRGAEPSMPLRSDVEALMAHGVMR